MKLFIDTNILIDYTTRRQPFTENAGKIIDLCINETARGYIAVHSLLNMFFILRKEIHDVSKRRERLIDLTEFLDIVEVDKSIVLSALKNDSFRDFEDCVQAECANRIGADYIITRNVKDFAQSPIKAITPEELLKEISQ